MGPSILQGKFNIFGKKSVNTCLIFTLPFKALTLLRSLDYNRRTCGVDMVGV